MHIGKKIATVITATTFVVLSAGSALAVSGQATGSVNVRTGPGTGYHRVDTLHSGERVEVKQCQGGWCYIEHSGPDGWVSANYLSRTTYNGGNSGGNSGGYSGGSSDPDIGFSFGFGSDGSHFGFSIGNPPPRPGWNNNWPSPQPRPVSKVCFYSGNNYTGHQFCMSEGRSRNSFGPVWNDKISSVRVFGDASVKMCQHSNFGGYCRVTSRNERALGPWLNDQISSLAVF